MLLLGYDQFQFIKLLFKNRWTVLYCTLLAKTEKEEERKAIEEEMKADPDKAAVLQVCPCLSFERNFVSFMTCFFIRLCLWWRTKT